MIETETKKNNDNKRKHIAFYINVLTDGGAERVMSQLANQFVEHGYRVSLITSFKAEGEYPVDSSVKRIYLDELQDFGNRLKRNIRLIIRLRKVINRIRPDVLVSFMQEPNFRAVLATRGIKKVKTVVSVRNDPRMEYAGRIGNFVGKYILPLADRCVFQTEDAKSWFPKSMQKKSKIIINEVSQKFFTQKWNPKGQKIVSVGRLTEQKNHKMLIDAFYEVSHDFPESTLEIYGEGPLRNELQSKIDNMKLTDKVFLKGNVNNIEEVLSHTSIFVLPSNYEGMPNALLEAMAVGVPSITTDCPCGGPKMIIDNGVNGILTPVSDYRKMANAIKAMLNSPDRMLEISNNAKKTSTKFEPINVFREWEKYLILEN